MSRLIFNRNGGSADEYGHLLALNRVLSGDVIEGLQVQQLTSAGMSVIVGQGSGRISTGTYPSSYGYFFDVDTTTGSPAGESVTIATAPTSNSRMDTIVAYVDMSVTPSTSSPNNPNNMLKFVAVAGTSAASPSAPTNATIQSTIGAANPFIKLANVLVGTNVTQITSANITDIRTMATMLNSAISSTAITQTVTLLTTTFNTNNTSSTQATGTVDGVASSNFSKTITVPLNNTRWYRVEVITTALFNSTSGSQAKLEMWDGTIGGTKIGATIGGNSNSSSFNGAVAVSYFKPAAGSHTINVSLLGYPTATAQLTASTGDPALLVITAV